MDHRRRYVDFSDHILGQNIGRLVAVFRQVLVRVECREHVTGAGGVPVGGVSLDHSTQIEILGVPVKPEQITADGSEIDECRVLC